MKKAIYKIENKINHKIYIGQSKDPYERFKTHCRACHGKKGNDNSLLSKAIQKYGRQNFSLEILGWFEDYNEKEKYYISYYKSQVPNGYNIQAGGEDPSHYYGEQNPISKLKADTVKKVQKELLDFKIPRKQIKKKYHLTEDMIRHIIEGNSWHDENLSYPLRPSEKSLNKQRVDKVKDLLKNTKINQKEIGRIVGWNRSAVTMINIGKNHYDENEDYPLRK